jgi:hypothetical protein
VSASTNSTAEARNDATAMPRLEKLTPSFHQE